MRQSLGARGNDMSSRVPACDDTTVSSPPIAPTLPDHAWAQSLPFQLLVVPLAVEPEAAPVVLDDEAPRAGVRLDADSDT